MTDVVRRASGKFRFRVDILRPSEELDARGQPTSPPVVCWYDIPADIDTLGGRSLVQAQAVYADAEYRIGLDFVQPIHEREIVRERVSGRMFHIGHVRNRDEADVDLELLCKELR